MGKIDCFTFEFCDFIPEVLEEGKVYLAPQHCACLHLCACGCGEEVSTPISKTEFSYSIDNGLISLSPSIGNHDFPCNSHYFIKDGRVRWSYRMDLEEIEAGRTYDRKLKAEYLRPTLTRRISRWLSARRRALLGWIGRK